MKTLITIEIETSKMKKVYDSDDPKDWTKKNEITDQVEKTMHQLFVKHTRSFVTDEMGERILDGCDEEMISVDGWDTLSDYGNVKFKVKSKTEK